MNITRIVIKGLHGYLDKDISFNKDLTLLVGINGSGKTSVLNLIKWMLDPSIPLLCITEFSSVQLHFEFNGSSYRIVCKHNRVYFSYRIYSKGKKYNPLTVKLQAFPKDIKNDDVLRLEMLQRYASLAPERREQESWALLSSLPNPTVIGLDRHLFSEESHSVFSDEPGRAKFSKKGLTSVSPMDRVKELVNREYRAKKNSILKLTSRLKNHLMFSTFDGSITSRSIDVGMRHELKISDIDAVERRVTDYFTNFEKGALSSSEAATIRRYFSQLKTITRKFQDNPDDSEMRFFYALNANQFVKISKLLKEFEKFEVESNEALEQINTYLETLNFFFEDSSKRLYFREDTSEIAYRALSEKGVPVSDFKDVKYLSSGEQQLFILFTYIAFSGRDGRLFIIDEPELSLHIKWQENFLDRLERITSSETQLIFATHSPILASKKRSKAKVLLPYNKK